MHCDGQNERQAPLLVRVGHPHGWTKPRAWERIVEVAGAASRQRRSWSWIRNARRQWRR